MKICRFIPQALVGVRNQGFSQIPIRHDAPRYNVKGTWQLTLESQQFPRVERVIDKLQSWTDDPATQHFAGTGRYELDFELPAQYIEDAIELSLDLDEVGDIAEVMLNDNRLGVAWMTPYRFSSNKTLRAGRNHLTVLVTNTLINHVAGIDESSRCAFRPGRTVWGD